MSAKKSSFLPLALLLIVSLFLASCASQTPEPTPVPPTATIVPPTNTPLPPTETPIPPTETPTETPLPTATATETLIPSDTPTSTPTDTATPKPASSGTGGYASVEDPIRIYFIALGTGGPVGCGDSVLWTGFGQSRTNDIARDVEMALNKLFSYKDEYVGGMYNPASHSNLKVGSVDFSNSSGLITVQLRGKYNRPDDPCENLRVKAQIWSTIRQHGGVKATNIYLNRVPFGDIVSNDK